MSIQYRKTVHERCKKVNARRIKPASTVDAAVNVGPGNVLIAPVGVYVGNNRTSVPENDGETVAGRNGSDAIYNDAEKPPTPVAEGG